MRDRDAPQAPEASTPDTSDRCITIGDCYFSTPRLVSQLTEVGRIKGREC